MAYPVYKSKAKRFMRLLRPSGPEQRFMTIMGKWWFVLHGVKREHSVGPYWVDFAVPRRKLGIEIDYHSSHRDIVKEYDRDQALAKRGWTVLHLRPPILDKPDKVKQKVKQFLR